MITIPEDIADHSNQNAYWITLTNDNTIRDYIKQF